MQQAKNLYKDKKVLVLGLGTNQGGVGAARFFAKEGAKVKVTDLKTKEQLQSSLDQLKDFPEIEYILGEHRFEDLDWADLIIKNPAIKPGNQYLKYAREKGKEVEMDMGIFLQFVKPSQIIGVTGTKGKSTTASLIYEALKTVHLPGVRTNHLEGVILAGNIGKSVLDTLEFVKPDSLVILELSSFQLEAFKQHKVSPKWAIITNIYPDHLNYYKTMEQYIESKKVIAKYQTGEDFLFLRKNDEITTDPKFLEGIKSNISYFSADDLPRDYKPTLGGEHNKENLAAALAVSAALGINQDQALEAMKSFTGVEFRLQLIKEVGGIKIYNDTAATTPAAAIQALNTYPNSILICGGTNKNLPYDELAKTISEKAKEVFFLEGDATEEILKFCKGTPYRTARRPLEENGLYNNLEKLLRDVKELAKPGDVILFSPGAASFNLFQNEFDRGRKFNTAVEKVFG